MARHLTWIAEGWACSECAWKFPVPSLLSDPEAKGAYDRLAAAKFQDHQCAHYPRERTLDGRETFAERARKLILRGYKPKDAVQLILQEVMLEYRNEPNVVEQARHDAEDFLRRIREGLI
jgi:hypothetical protein